MFGAGYLLEMLRSSSSSTDSKKINEISPKRRKISDNLQNATIASTSTNISSIETTSIVRNPEASSIEIVHESIVVKTVENLEIDQQPIVDQSRIEKSVESISIAPDPSSSIVAQYYPRLNFDVDPRLLLREFSIFSSSSSKSKTKRFENNFLKGCKWSPDGSCLLTNSEDRELRVFTLPTAFYESKFFEISPATSSIDQSGAPIDQNRQPPAPSTSSPSEAADQNTLTAAARSNVRASLNLLSSVSAGELVYDYCWYPLMNSSTPESCVYAQTSRDHPIHLRDAVSGDLCATYSPIDQLDEVTHAFSLAFAPDSSRLLAGFNKCVRIFDTYRPGRQISTRSTWRKRQGGQSGIISCIAVCPTMPSLYACGSYGRSVATYADSFEDGPLETMQAEKMGGVTHLVYHSNGHHLYSGGRMDSKIICWDMRHPGRIYASYERDASTNQRFYFDLDRSGRFLISGGDDGVIKTWDTSKSPNEQGFVEPVCSFRAHRSTGGANGISINGYLPILATAGGRRTFPTTGDQRRHGRRGEDTEENESDDGEESTSENCVKLWFIGEETT